MAKNSLSQLAGELKNFLQSCDEDEFITTAATPHQAAAAISRVPKKQAVTSQETAAEVFFQSAHIPEQVTSAQPAPATAPAMQENSTLTIEFRSVTHPTTAVPNASAQTTSNTQEATPMLTTAQKQAALQELAETIKQCSRCPLGSARLNAVPGEGNVDTELMFVGEGPGYDEDRQGRPFVGRAGQLLDKMIAAMGLTREQVFIANIAKCHPMVDPQHPEKHGNDRAPNSEEIACCRKFLEKQIAIICPKYIVALGGVSAKALISDAKSLGALRGQFYNLHLDSVELPRPVQILATFHPAALLRNPNWKKDAWKDLQLVMAKLGLKGIAK